VEQIVFDRASPNMSGGQTSSPVQRVLFESPCRPTISTRTISGNAPIRDAIATDVAYVRPMRRGSALRTVCDEARAATRF